MSGRRLGFFLAIYLLFLADTGLGQEAETQLEAAVQSAAKLLSPSVLKLERVGARGRIDGVPFSPTAGTALVIDSDGWLLTSYCFVADQPTAILVTLPTGKKVAAQHVSTDFARNLALLKVGSDEKLIVPEFVQRRKLQVGQTAVALGRTLDASVPQVSVGMISATNRIWGKAVQTDAKVSLANFGGPLVDLKGQVIGILTPLSTRGDGPLAGIDWYDSGIGFAVPVNEVLARFDSLKQGVGSKPGILGVNFKSGNLYEESVEVAFCLGSSPAASAGLKIGDEIIECQDQTVNRLAQLKHAIGPMYAGDLVTLKVRRAETSDAKGESPNYQTLQLSFKLAETLPPFLPVGIGLATQTIKVPETEGKSELTSRLILRYVESDGPAAQVGLRPGDQLLSIGRFNQVNEASQIRLALASVPDGETLKIKFRRGNEDQSVDVDVKRRTTAVPETLPVAKLEPGDSDVVDVVLPEDTNPCYAIIPPKTAQKNALTPGVLLWLPESGKHDRDESVKRWKKVTRDQNMIVVVLASEKDRQWDLQEVETAIRAVASLKKMKEFDANRVVIGGTGNGGTLASLVAHRTPDRFQGLVLQDAPCSARIGNIKTSPIQPQMVLRIGNHPEFDKSYQKLNDALIPIQTLDAATVDEILRWSALVDRL